ELIAARRRRSRSAEGELLPAEAVVADMVHLAVTESDAQSWQQLEARARDVLTGAHLIEFYELAARVALRRAWPEKARAWLAQALDLAGRTPNVMKDRLAALAASAG